MEDVRRNGRFYHRSRNVVGREGDTEREQERSNSSPVGTTSNNTYRPNGPRYGRTEVVGTTSDSVHLQGNKNTGGECMTHDKQEAANIGQPQSFDDLMDVILPSYIKFLRDEGIKYPGNYYVIDLKRKTISMLIPLDSTARRFYAIALHYSERKHYTPPSKFFDEEKQIGHVIAAIRALNKAIEKKGNAFRKNAIEDITIICMCNSYTKSVKGKVIERDSGKRIGILVAKKYNELIEGLKRVFNIVRNYIATRLKKLRESCKGKLYGDVEEFARYLENFLIFVDVRILGKPLWASGEPR